MGFSRASYGLHFWIFLANLCAIGWSMMAFFKLTTYLCPILTTTVAAAGMGVCVFVLCVGVET
jgi:hypothetical protein